MVHRVDEYELLANDQIETVAPHIQKASLTKGDITQELPKKNWIIILVPSVKDNTIIGLRYEGRRQTQLSGGVLRAALLL